MFDQRGTESRQDGIIRVLQPKRREERANETFEKSPAFKVSLLVRIRNRGMVKCLFSSIQSTARGLFWREMWGGKNPKNPPVMFYHLRRGAVNVRVLQLTAITSPGLANSAT